VIYPSATRSGGCFDVYSQEALRRNRGSDPVGIRSMVAHVQQRYGADPDRIFVTGASSGAMMTNVLLGENRSSGEIKQWTTVLGVSQSLARTDTPQSGWTRNPVRRHGCDGRRP
jgi:dipeptidyl aminopeptidase/acylaminoacyl peptidase